MPTEDAAQPPVLFGQRRMNAPPLFRAYRVQLSRESLPVVRRFTTKWPARLRGQ
jgi:hypothetical protein